MTAPDPAVALAEREAVVELSRRIARDRPTDGMPLGVIARVVVAMDAELTTLRARVGEVERERDEALAAARDGWTEARKAVEASTAEWIATMLDERRHDVEIGPRIMSSDPTRQSQHDAWRDGRMQALADAAALVRSYRKEHP